jgi:ankyrin repeat protein
MKRRIFGLGILAILLVMGAVLIGCYTLTPNEQLRNAAYNGNLGEVQRLLQNGADINARLGYYNSTALIVAAVNGRFEIVKYLVEKGADINLRDNDGDAAMSSAYDRGYLQIYNYLKERGAIEFAPRQSSFGSSSTPSQQQTQKTYIVNVTSETNHGNWTTTYNIKASSAQEAQILAEGQWRSTNFSNNKFLYAAVTGSY